MLNLTKFLKENVIEKTIASAPACYIINGVSSISIKDGILPSSVKCCWCGAVHETNSMPAGKNHRLQKCICQKALYTEDAVSIIPSALINKFRKDERFLVRNTPTNPYVMPFHGKTIEITEKKTDKVIYKGYTDLTMPAFYMEKTLTGFVIWRINVIVLCDTDMSVKHKAVKSAFMDIKKQTYETGIGKDGTLNMYLQSPEGIDTQLDNTKAGWNAPIIYESGNSMKEFLGTLSSDFLETSCLKQLFDINPAQFSLARQIPPSSPQHILSLIRGYYRFCGQYAAAATHLLQTENYSSFAELALTLDDYYGRIQDKDSKNRANPYQFISIIDRMLKEKEHQHETD